MDVSSSGGQKLSRSETAELELWGGHDAASRTRQRNMAGGELQLSFPAAIRDCFDCCPARIAFPRHPVRWAGLTDDCKRRGNWSGGRDAGT